MNTIKDNLRKYVIYQTACLRNLQYDIENLAKSMEIISPETDIRVFIEQNKSNYYSE